MYRLTRFSRAFLFSVLIFVFVVFPSHQFLSWKRKNSGYKKIHYELKEFDVSDESHYQRTSFHNIKWAVLISMPNIFKFTPVWEKKDEKYWPQIEFRCFLYNENEHPAEKTNENSGPIKEDFTFTVNDLKNSPEKVKHLTQAFSNRKHERFGFVIHGFVTAHKHYDIHLMPWTDAMANDLRSKLKMNVIVVDWTKLSVWNYLLVSRGNIVYVGHSIHFVIENLAKMMGMSEEEIGRFLLEMLCMGHSLGAHICGVVGGLAKHHQTHMMGTIIGLDPAGPFFSPAKTIPRCLTWEDARRVLIIHSCGKLLGTLFRLGHEDYYANGGNAVIPSSPGLSHMRVTNIVRELIWTKATGYISRVPDRVIHAADIAEADKITFDLGLIPDALHEASLVNHPIYLPVNVKSPYFNDNPPETIPAYKITTIQNGWHKIKFIT